MSRIKNSNDLLIMLDQLFRQPAPRWDKFYEDKTKEIPFFVDYPDENLVKYYDTGMLRPKKVLELGSGNGRNAIYMTQQGSRLDAVDISQEAITWAKENASKQDVSVNFICSDIFELDLSDDYYDFVYDSGLLHHLPPHQRFQYIEQINKTLKSNGLFGIVCFAPGFEEIGGAESKSDENIYKVNSMQGGIAYSKEDLREILSDYFEELEIRHMRECSNEEKLFGKKFLWASLWRKKL